MDVDNEVWPVTIVPARYGGAYEGALWLAFPFHPNSLPLEWDADDLVASRYYEEHSDEIGEGESPTEAYENLQRIMRARQPR